MFRILLALLLCLPLLGCRAQQMTSTPLPDRLIPTKETENDILRCYPLNRPECRFFASDEDLIQVTEAQIFRFSGKNLVRTAAYPLSGDHCRVSVAGQHTVCFDPEERTVVILSRALEVLYRFPMPEKVQGTPLLCPEGTHLYYGTDCAVCVLDVHTGLQKQLREGSRDEAAVLGLMDGEAVLVCSSGGKTNYLSAEDGRIKNSSPPVSAAASVGSRDCLCVRCGENDCLYLGQTMFPLKPGMHFLAFLPEMNAALVHREADSMLVLYDLTTGNQTAQQAIPEGAPEACATSDGRVFFRIGSRLYQWMPSPHPVRDPSSQITQVYTAAAPDRNGLTQCQSRAAAIRQQYGMEIRLQEAALEYLPANCTAEAEHLVPILSDTLERMERSLLRLPAELVKAASQSSGSTTLGIVRSLTVDGECADYLQFWNGRNCCILLAATDSAGDALLRCLSPLLDARILSLSPAYDLWDSLNPEGFAYGRQPPLSGFADERAVFSPAEDRAGLLLAALRPGNRELFCDAILQKKLRALCTGIRDAFPAVRQKALLPWEQYLWEPV